MCPLPCALCHLPFTMCHSPLVFGFRLSTIDYGVRYIPIRFIGIGYSRRCPNPRRRPLKSEISNARLFVSLMGRRFVRFVRFVGFRPILRARISLAKRPLSCSNNPMRTGNTALRPLYPWAFRPDIGSANIRAKLPENPPSIRIRIAGRNDLLING